MRVSGRPERSGERLSRATAKEGACPTPSEACGQVLVREIARPCVQDPEIWDTLGAMRIVAARWADYEDSELVARLRPVAAKVVEEAVAARAQVACRRRTAARPREEAAQ